MSTKELVPAYVSSPGEILEMELVARGWTQQDLADIIAKPVQAVNEIIKGKKEITPETAIKLSEALGTSAELWLGLEADYRLFKTRQNDGANHSVARKGRLYELAPVRELLKRGWVQASKQSNDLEAHVLKFLGLRSLDDTPSLAAVNFRQSVAWSPEEAYVYAWKMRVEQLASQQKVVAYSKKKLEAALPDLLALSQSIGDVTQIPEFLTALGVHFILVPHLPKSYIDGAAFEVRGRPVVALSLRHACIDRFWFTLLHELAHILLHEGTYLDVLYDSSETPKDKEKEANEWASEQLISSSEWKDFLKSSARYSKVDVIRFAHGIGRHPGIVVGRLHHEKRMGWDKLRQLQPNVKRVLEPFFDQVT
jgi:HTH-type transcriptional regulator / antitoxin HigA